MDRLATSAASHLVRWLGHHVDGSKTEWISGLGSELDSLDTGWERLAWAVSGLPLLWTFRPRASAKPQLVVTGSALMSQPVLPAAPKFQGRDVLSLFTALCLTAVVVGYVVLLLPVFENMIASTGQTLDLKGIDFAQLGINTARVAGLLFVGGLIYIVRRPVSERARQTAVMFGGVNLILGVSAVLLGVTLIQFVILFTPALQGAVRGRERVQQALYDLATVDDPTNPTHPTTAAAASDARFLALAKVVHRQLMVSTTGRVEESTSQRLLAILPEFAKRPEYGSAAQDANLLAGLVALEKNGNLTHAKRYLSTAGNIDGSPNRPSMRLAQALLWRGERESVLAYLQQCRRFWKDDGGQLDAWTKQINDGSVNVFGPTAY